MAKAKNWTHLVEKYRGQWVALADDETTVLAAAATAKEAHQTAQIVGILDSLPRESENNPDVREAHDVAMQFAGTAPNPKY